MSRTVSSAEVVRIVVDGRPVTVPAGVSVAVALLNHGVSGFRRSEGGEPRGPLCGMGICFECRATVDGRPQVRTCAVLVRDGMEVRTDG